MKICALLPYANPHVTGWLDEFISISSHSIVVGVANSVSLFRKNYFSEADANNKYLYFFKDKKHKRLFYREVRSADVIITLGIFDWHFVKCLFYAPAKTRVFVLSEPFNPISSKNSLWVRKAYAFFLKLLLNKKVNFLAIGGSAVKDYYNKLGFETSNFYNFGYFPKLEKGIIRSTNNVVKFLFVGQLIKRKGVDVLISTLKYLNLNYSNWSMLIVGDGDMKDKLIDLIKNDSRIKYISLINDQTVLRRIYSESDVLLLPSYFDGWGAVVNEALASGCSLLVSNRVFASNYLVKDSFNGFTFNPYEIDTLYSKLDMYFQNNNMIANHSEFSLKLYDEWNHINAASAVKDLITTGDHTSQFELLKVL